jgi:hypothetical protein
VATRESAATVAMTSGCAIPPSVSEETAGAAAEGRRAGSDAAQRQRLQVAGVRGRRPPYDSRGSESLTDTSMREFMDEDEPAVKTELPSVCEMLRTKTPFGNHIGTGRGIKARARSPSTGAFNHWHGRARRPARSSAPVLRRAGLLPSRRVSPRAW